MDSDRKNPLIIVGSFFLIFVAVVCTCGAIISAFSFDVDAGLLLITWFVVVIALSILAAFWRGKGILVLMLPVALMLIWKMPEIVEGAKWVINFISSEFNKWLVVPILFPDASATVNEVSFFFTAAGVVISFMLAAAICLRRSAFLTILATVPIVFITFVLIHSQPNIWFLIGLLAVYLTLLISSSLYCDNFQKRAKAVFPSLALALLLLGSTYLLAQPKSYRRETRMNTIDHYLRNFASQIGLARVKFGVGWPISSALEWRFNTDYVEISDAGTRVITDQDILEVNASEAGTFYLRGYSMQHFDGRSWTVNSNTLRYFEGWEDLTVSDNPATIADNYRVASMLNSMMDVKSAHMNVRILHDTTNVTYAPYYSFGVYDMLSYDKQDFTFMYTEDSILKMAQTLFSNGITFFQETLSDYSKQSWKDYTQIEYSTAEGLRRLAIEAGIDLTADREVIVSQVVSYIRASGSYTLSPYVIPADEDFALYFLQTSKQGYCIHFATAATMMLRALGIPARFTSGFVATVPRDRIDKPVPVTDRNAHAWVEVFYEEVGWLPYEVTPAATGSNIPVTGPNTYSPSSDPDGEHNGENNNPNQAQDQDGSGRETPTPGTGSKTGKEGDKKNPTVPMWLVIVIISASCIALYAVALSIYRQILRKIRKKRFEQKDTNAAVICAWRYMTHLSRSLKNRVSNHKVVAPAGSRRIKMKTLGEIEAIALKARFSQHTITEEERTKVINYAATFADEVYRLSKDHEKLWIYIRGLK